MSAQPSRCTLAVNVDPADPLSPWIFIGVVRGRAVAAWVVALGALSLACARLGLRPEVTRAAPEELEPAMSASAERKVRNACSASVKSKAAKRQKRMDRAETDLRAAEERVRAVQELGDASTFLRAMKDRDSAAANLASIDPIDVKRLRNTCRAKATARAERVFAERQRGHAKLQREQESRDAAEAAEAAERRRAALRVFGEALQRAAQPQPAYTAPIYSAPLPPAEPARSPALTPAPINWTPITTPGRLEEPVDQCTACIQQWCSFQCTGIGSDCVPCMKQWCDFQC